MLIGKYDPVGFILLGHLLLMVDNETLGKQYHKEFQHFDREMNRKMLRVTEAICKITKLTIMSEVMEFWPRQARNQFKRFKGGDTKYREKFLCMYSKYSHLLPPHLNPPENHFNINKLAKFVQEIRN